MLTCAAPDGSWLPAHHRSFFDAALAAMAEVAFRPDRVRALLPALVDGFVELAPSEDDVVAWHAELRGWVRWHRLPGYWLSAFFQLAAVRLSTPLVAPATELFAHAQIVFGDDLALASLETSYVNVLRHRAAFGANFDYLRETLTAQLDGYRRRLVRWAAPFEGHACNPLADHLYSWLTSSWLAADVADESPSPNFDDDAWWHDLVKRADREGAVWHSVVARRFLGLRLAGRANANVDTDAKMRLALFSVALDTARTNRLDTEIGHLWRLRGQALHDLGRLDEAVVALRSAVAFEGAAPAQELATYWQSLSARELGDALLRRALAGAGALAGSGAEAGKGTGAAPTTRAPAPGASASPIDPGHPDLTYALEAHRVGRRNFDLHMSIQCPQPLARAAKHQMQRTFAANALFAAAAAQSTPDLLAEWEASGPRETTARVAEMAAPSPSPDDVAGRAKFRRDRAHYFAALNTAPTPVEDYLADVAAHAPERREYLQRHVNMAKHLAAEQSADAIAARLLELRLPNTLFLLFHLAADAGTLLLVDLESGSTAPFPVAFGEAQVRAWHAEYQHEWLAAADAADAAGRAAALGRQLRRYEAALAPVLEPLLRFIPGRHVKVFPRLQMNGLPFHALRFGGQPLVQWCASISVGQTLGLFLANHAAQREDRAAACGLRIVVGDQVPWYRQILPAVRLGHGGALDELDRPTWPSLRDAIIQRPARDTVFACHGHFDATRVADSALHLGGADAGVSFARLFEELDLSGCRSVTMGSCESGVARTEVAAEYLGLAAAMLASGARYVVGALWTIPQLATAIAVERLASGLRDESASVAVLLSHVHRELLALDREAARAWVSERLAGHAQLPKVLAELLVRGERPFADPYHWAGLVTFGDV